MGFKPKEVIAWSMRTRRGMDILLTQEDTYTINMVVKWHINVMLRYLHVYLQYFKAGLVSCMVQHVDYALIPPTHEG